MEALRQLLKYPLLSLNNYIKSINHTPFIRKAFSDLLISNSNVTKQRDTSASDPTGFFVQGLFWTRQTDKNERTDLERSGRGPSYPHYWTNSSPLFYTFTKHNKVFFLFKFVKSVGQV